MLERLDPDPEYWEAKRGAAVGYFHQVASGQAEQGSSSSSSSSSSSRADEVLKLLAASKNMECTAIVATLKNWYLTSLGKTQKQMK